MSSADEDGGSPAPADVKELVLKNVKGPADTVEHTERSKYLGIQDWIKQVPFDSKKSEKNMKPEEKVSFFLHQLDN
jgi:hypothetical protein